MFCYDGLVNINLMAERSEKITTGVVTEALPNATFRVKLDEENSDEIIAYLSGRMRMNRIKVLVGDKVRVEISVHGKTKGRIVHRL